MQKELYQKRLTDLRRWLSESGLSGFLVPRGDEFLNKITAYYAERLKWISGFAGSSGTLLVLPHEAILFTDSRYTERARKEIDSTLFQIRDVGEMSLEKWLQFHAAEGQVFAYDPWLYSFAQINAYKKTLAPQGILLQACASNPIDALWEDQPERPKNPIWIHPLSYAGETTQQKKNSLCASLQKDECFFSASGDTIAWLLNVRGSDIRKAPIPHAYILLKSCGEINLFIDPTKLTPQVTEELHQDVIIRPIDEMEFFLQPLVANQKVLLDPRETPGALEQFIKKAGGQIIFRQNPFSLPKALKNNVELTQIRAGHVIDGATLARFFHWIDTVAKFQKNLGEWDISQKLSEFQKEGLHYWDESFETIVGYGSNGAIIHYFPLKETQKIIQPTSLLLIDTGVQYLNGVTTDVTRTIALGNPTLEEKECFTRVLKGHIALSRTVFPQKTRGIHLDALARCHLWESFLDYPHSTGHGVGSFLNVHEGPHSLSFQEDSVDLVPSMIVTIEPGYYKEGHFGIRLENMVEIVEKGKSTTKTPYYGFSPLTLAPFDRRLILKDLLTQGEKEWLNQYHCLVYERISPLLEEPVRQWLEEKTSALGE